LELNQKITAIDSESKRIFSQHCAFHYDKLLIATGSIPKTLFDITTIENASTFRNHRDSMKICTGIKGKNVVIVGAGPIALELLDTLMNSNELQTITLLVRGDYLYSPVLSREGIELIRHIFEADPRIRISFNDQILDTSIQGNRLKSITTKQGVIEEPFLIFGRMRSWDNGQ
jgi:quinone-reactive Ni/Fe-hydrogenase small subunit